MNWSHLGWKLPSETRYWKKVRRKGSTVGRTRQKISDVTSWPSKNDRILEMERGSTT